MFQFVEFAETAAAVDADVVEKAFLDRIATTDAGGQIASLEDLVRFAKVRYPDHYGDDPWRTPLSKPYGLDAMRALWAAYLRWAEVTHNPYYEIATAKGDAA
jgi:hypothetical protein